MREIDDVESVGTDSSSDYEARENLWDEQWPSGGEPQSVHSLEEVDNLDEETGFPGAVGTSDSIESVRDAEPYMAPSDPPVLPGGREGIHIATGFGTDVEEEMSQDQPLRNDADLEEEALLMLRQDALTSHYNLHVRAEDGVVTIRGRVSDVDDAEHALSIVGEIPGVADVVDDMITDPNVT